MGECGMYSFGSHTDKWQADVNKR